MSDGPEWFAPKRYGYGATPISWQGWALTFGFVAAIIAVAIGFRGKIVQSIAIFIPLTVVFTVICARTTRGGWRWRWGDGD